MKRLAAIALVCLMVTALILAGCKDESKPVFSRVTISPMCGVVPLDVQGYAVTTGGNETGDPTGGNATLDIQWNFDDGTSSSTSRAYHRYADPGIYNVVVTATDADGQQADPYHAQITVLVDSLIVDTTTNFPDGTFTTADTLRLDFTAESCDVDPEVDGDYAKISFEWQVTGPTDHLFYARDPEIVLDTPGDYNVRLLVNYPAWAVFREVNLPYTVSGP